MVTPHPYSPDVCYNREPTQQRYYRFESYPIAPNSKNRLIIVSYRIASYSTVSYRIASYSTVSYRIASYSTVSYRIASYWTYHIVHYCTVCIRPYCIIVTVLYRSMLYRNVQHRYYRTVSFAPFPSHRFYRTISQHNAPTNRFVQYHAYHTISQVLFHMNFILIAYLIGKFVKTFFFLSETLGNEAIHTSYTCSLSNISLYIKCISKQ